MTTLTLEDCKARILSRLQDAGAAGLTRSALGVRGGGNTARAYREALSGLESALLIGNLGTRSTPRYVLREHYCPLELAYAHMEAKTVPGNPKLYIATELRRGLKGTPNDKAEEAIKLLVRDGKLLRLTRGRTAFFLRTAYAGARNAGQVAPCPAEATGYSLQKQPVPPPRDRETLENPGGASAHARQTAK